ncbi:HotDog domain-containing protein [Aspergillus karnatakaensis]|uniref:PaaI family thioesterase n=1 Tax=Aspergillus karnatakaensis TaxID=1810916 RepID=UPI003CCD50C8
MSSIPRSVSRLSRLLRKQSAASTLQRITPSIRTAQTQAAPSPLENQPPPHFQHVPKPHAPASSPAPASQTPHLNANTNATTTDPLSSHPLLLSLRANKSLKETRPHLTMPSTHRTAHLVAGTLSGATKLTTAPYLFLSRPPSSPSAEPHKSTATTLFHPSRHLCGHPGFIHGGFLSVMFDEIFAHCVSQSFKSGTGMTANLNVDFRKPAVPERVFVLDAEVVKVEGRKAWVEGVMRMLGEGESGVGEERGVVVAEGRALFVEPRFAESMVPVYRN